MEADGRAPEPDRGLLRYVFRKDVLLRCSLIAVVVGCILTAANQYEALLQGPLTAKLATKISVNFLVPFIVSSTSAAMNRRSPGKW